LIGRSNVAPPRSSESVETLTVISSTQVHSGSLVQDAHVVSSVHLHCDVCTAAGLSHAPPFGVQELLDEHQTHTSEGLSTKLLPSVQAVHER
jgi:hypothetical protein